MAFKYPWMLLLVPLLAALIYWWDRKKGRRAAFKFPSESLLPLDGKPFKVRLYGFLPFLRILIVCLIALGLARPQTVTQEVVVESEAVEIVLGIDVSTSMLAEDFTDGSKRRNRLMAVKDVVKDFIKARTGDRIGIVVFAGKSYTLSPITFDGEWLLEKLKSAEIGMIKDGTAIGLGLATALRRLESTSENAKSRGKVVILLTDGMNNSGEIAPLTAAEAAKALDIKVYTIGAGSKDPVPFPFKSPFGGVDYRNVVIDIDEDTLKEIATRTGGRFFRAKDMDSLKEVYREIDQLEKVKVEQKFFYHYRELFSYLIVPALFLLFLEVLLKTTFFRRIP